MALTKVGKEGITGISNSSDANAITIDSSERVGIGTNSPSQEMHLYAGSGATDFLIEQGSTGNAYLHTKNSNREYLIGTGGDALKFYDLTADAERMRIDSSGNLLVGTTDTLPAINNVEGIALSAGSFGGRLEVSRDNNEAVSINRKTSNGNLMSFKKDGTTVGSIGVDGDSTNLMIGNGVVGLRFVEGSNHIRPANIDTGGNRDNAIDLGYGSSRFKDGYFSNSVRANFFAGQADDNTFMGITGGDVITFATGGTERMRIDSSGSLLIGTTDDIIWNDASGEGVVIYQGKAFQVARNNDACVQLNRQGSDGSIQLFARGGTQVGRIDVTASATSYVTSSDRRLKSNIEDAASASDKIDAIQVRQFDWNVDDSHQDYGLIAQELQSIEPLAVSGNADSDEMMGVDYSKLVPMLIKEIQELRGRVAALEAN